MENENKKKNYSITSKGVESQVFESSLDAEDEIGVFISSTLSEPNGLRTITKLLASEDAYILFKDTKDNEIGKTQSGLDIDLKDSINNNLTELLKSKENMIKEMRYEISEKNKKIDELQTTQRLKLEKIIEDNTKEIRALKETIQKYQEIIQPPTLTQEVIDKYLSRFITEDID